MGELKGNVSLRAAAREVSIHTKILFHFSFFMLWRAVLWRLICLVFTDPFPWCALREDEQISPNRCHPKAYTTGGNKVSGLRDCSKPFDDDLSDE